MIERHEIIERIQECLDNCPDCGPDAGPGRCAHCRSLEAAQEAAEKLLANPQVSRYPKARCARCDCPYGSHGFHDLIVPDDVWRQISPTGDEGGLLCPTCIVAAVNELGLTEVPAYFASGPLRLTTDAQAQHALEALADCQEGLEKTEQQIESLMAERDQYQQALNAIIKAVNAGEMDRVEAIVAGATLNATNEEPTP